MVMLSVQGIQICRVVITLYDGCQNSDIATHKLLLVLHEGL